MINSPDPNTTRDFYEKTVGFKLSDTLWSQHMGEMMQFMRCNDWHHSLAIARGPHVSLHHVSFEMRGLDEYMRGTGRLMRAGIKKIWGPGRHMAGNNTFSYFLDPQRQHRGVHHRARDDRRGHVAPAPLRLLRPRGHRTSGAPPNPMNEFIARDSFNDPDKGVFVAPPV